VLNICKLLTYSGWESHLVRSSQPPILSLGAEAVMLGLSVDKGTIEPEVLTEVIELRNVN